MAITILIPKKKTSVKGGRMGDKTNSVTIVISGIISDGSLSHIDSSTAVPSSNRNLIFNG